MDKKKQLRFLAIAIGVVISIFVIIIGFKLVSNIFSRAADQAPRDVIVTDITQNSAKASWATGIEAQGVVSYGTSPTALNFNAPETVPSTSHSVDLTLLSASTTYYFQITVGDKNYDNGGVPWTFSTKAPVTPTVAPTITPIQLNATPSPVQSLRLPGTTVATICDETDCAKIKLKLGDGCETDDYFRCIRKLTPTVNPTP